MRLCFLCILASVLFACTLSTVEAYCFRRYFRTNCDPLRGENADNLKQRIFDHSSEQTSLNVTAEQYNKMTGMFERNISITGNSMTLQQFCSAVNAGENFDLQCLHVQDQISDNQIAEGQILTISGNCSYPSSDDEGNQKRIASQITDALRDYDRALLHHIQYQNHDSENEDVLNMTYTSDLPLLTTDSSFATAYANESWKFLLKNAQQSEASILKWDLQVTKVVSGIWNVVLHVEQNRTYPRAQCEDYDWTTTPQNAGVVCEGNYCYERPSCVPTTCKINHVGQNCEECPPGKFSLKSGISAQRQETTCLQKADVSKQCQQIVDFKLDSCSSAIDAETKRLTSLVLDVECYSDGRLQLTWGENVNIVQSNNQIYEFIEKVLNMSQSEFTLYFVEREIDAEGSGRRRLLQSSNIVKDNSTTNITIVPHTTTTPSTPPPSTENETPSPPADTTPVSTASTPSQSSSNSHSTHVLIGTTSKTSTSWWNRDSIFAIFVSVAAVVVLALAAVAYSLSSQGQNTPWYYNNANIYNVQQYDYAPVYVSSLTPRR